MADESAPRMPRWVLSAVAVFWLGLLSALVLMQVVRQVAGLLLILLVSLFLALAIEPGVNWLARRRWRRGVATAVLLFGSLSVGLFFLGAIGTLVGAQIADVLRDSSRYVDETVTFINDTFGANIDPAGVEESIADPDGPIQQFIARQQSQVFDLSLSVLGGLLQLLAVLLFTFYLVADGPRLRRTVLTRLPERRQRLALAVWNLAVDKTGGFLYSRALLAVISSLLHWVAFQVIGTPAPIAMALWVGVVSQFIPVLGTYLAAILPVVLSFLESPTQALAVVVFIVVYQQIENYFVAPRITSRTLQVHPAVAFGSALFGAAVLGPVGAILALPGVAMAQSIISTWGQRYEVLDDDLLRDDD